MGQSRAWWGIGVLLIALSVVALSGFTAIAQTPAGTVISNQVIATYTDNENEVRTVTSNVVYATVQQVAAFTITPDTEQTVEVVAGQWVTYPFRVTNTGNGPDYLWMRPYLGDNATLSPVPGSYELYIDVNGDGVVDAGDILFNTNPPADITAPNPGEPKYGPVASGDYIDLLARFRVPTDASEGMEIHIHIETVSEAGYPDVFDNSGTIAFAVVEGGVISASMQAESNYAADTTKVLGDGSGEITYTVQLVNQGTHSVTGAEVNLAIPDGTTFKPGSFSVNGSSESAPFIGNHGVHSAGPIGTGQAYQVKYSVTVTGGAVGGTVISNQATVNPGVGRPLVYTNEVQTQVLQTSGLTMEKVEPVTNYDVNPTLAGTTYDFKYRVTNNGNASDTVNITADITNAWAVELYQADGLTPLPKIDTAYSIGTVAPNEAIVFIVRVKVPASALSDNDTHTVTVKAYPAAAPNEYGEEHAYLRNVSGPHVKLVVANGNLSGEPGKIVVYELQVQNLGPAQDLFELAVEGLPAGYVSQFYNEAGNPISDLVVPGMTNANVTLRVVIPAQTEPTDIPINFTVRATSQNNGGIDDTVALQLSVTESVIITIAPHRTGSVNRGGYTVYTLSLQNSGNTEQDVVVGTSLAGVGETKLEYSFVDENNGFIGTAQSVTLAAGSTQSIRVRVEAPTPIAAGTVEIVNVTATVSGVVQDTAVLTTTVTGGELQLIQDVDESYPKPGDLMTYTITATNTSVIPLDDVEIYEKVPEHTVFVSTNEPAGLTVYYSTNGGGEAEENWSTTRPANPEDVTNVKWVLDGELAANGTVVVSLTVQVK